VDELIQTLAGVHAILDKASQVRKKRGRNQVVARALKGAASEPLHYQ